MTSSRTNPPNKCIAFGGILIFVLGITLVILKTRLLQFLLHTVLILKPKSPIVDLWLKTPVPLPTDIYFFNWTNPEDFHNFSIKPKLEQVGPYRFVQSMEKVDVVWNDNDTVTYKQVKTWYQRKKQCASLNKRITVLNAIALCCAHNARNYNYFMKKLVSVGLAVNAPDISLTKTANEFIFGYDDPIINLNHMLPFAAPHIPNYKTFGVLLIRNGSADFDGVFNKAIGVDGDFDIRNWNYYNVTPYFKSSCAKVQGAEGELFSYRDLSKNYVDVFVSDLCRYLRLDFENEVIVKGILGYKYSIKNSALDNGTLIPGNECFCAGDCIPSGMLNVSSCRYGLPIYVSLPHFYWADSVYLDAVEGLRPEKTKHESFIVLEPQTGIPLQTIARAQLNVFVHPIEGIQTHEHLPQMYFPILWTEQTYTIEGAVEFQLNIFLWLPYVIDAVSVILIIISFYLIVFVAYKSMLISLYKKLYKQKYSSKTVELEQVPLQTSI